MSQTNDWPRCLLSPREHMFDSDENCLLCNQPKAELISAAINMIEIHTNCCKATELANLFTFYSKRTKPLAEVTAADVPRGLDPEDVAIEIEGDHPRRDR